MRARCGSSAAATGEWGISSSAGSFLGRDEGRKAAGGAPFNSRSRGRRSGLKKLVIWLCSGLVLIGLWRTHSAINGPPVANDGEKHPTVTIFASPRPLSSSLPSGGGLAGLVGARQELAVRSWLAVSPSIDVVLFGKHPSIYAFAEALGPRVSVEPGIDFTFLGTPFFHSMVSRMQSSNSDISVLVDSEIILFPNFLTALHHAHKLKNDWLLMSLPAVAPDFPFHLDSISGGWLDKDGVQLRLEKLDEFLTATNQNPRRCSERAILAWNRGRTLLHAGVLPPFLYGKGTHYQWLLNEVLSTGFRLALDASEAFSSFYPETLGHWSKRFMNYSNEGDGSESILESKCNSHLASLYGTLYFQQDIYYDNVVRLVKCTGQYFFMNASGKVAYPLQLTDNDLEKVGLLKRRHLQSNSKKWTNCVGNGHTQDGEGKCSVMKLPKDDFELSAPSLPFSLESLLHMIADEDKSVVLAAAGYSYKDMLMSWVCRLRNLSVTNFLVCALDIETYQFAVLQGLPVYKDSLAPNNISFDNCHFGSDCFQRVTKVKSRLVLQILRLGYNVLLSDVDIYWFHNPLPLLSTFGPAVLLAQSDEYNKTGPINLPRRLNSGFYFARSDPPTISALEKMVKHASSSGLSEQPSFYDVLCGEGGANRVGSDRCLEPETNVTVHFLDRNWFPNGAFGGLWEKKDVASACMKKGCLILHNNWISGRQRKIERQIRSGLWAYDASSRMCLQR